MSSSTGRTWTYPDLGEEIIVVETERDGHRVAGDVERRPINESTGRTHYSEFSCAKCGEPMRFRYCLNCRDLEREHEGDDL